MLFLSTAWACETGLPQRLGSQDFGTAQSQLAVEQESIQFIPLPLTMGQRNQFQSRGAIQAPSTAQMGQRMWVEVRYRAHRPGLLVRYRAHRPGLLVRQGRRYVISVDNLGI